MTNGPYQNAYCINCGTQIDGADNIDGSGGTPSPGDISVCIYCGTAAQFTEELALTAIEDQELINSINSDPQVSMLRLWIALGKPLPSD